MTDYISREAAIDALAMADAKKGWRSMKLSDMQGCLLALPSVQSERKTGDWLHDLLQDAIDDGIITETQASRLMDMIAEDNT